MREIRNIVVHCTASGQGLRAIDIVSYHLNILRWEAPGYHYIVEPDGHVVETWPDGKVANGVKGHNSSSIHVSWIGGIDPQGRAVDNRTPAQKASLRRLLGELLHRYPRAVIKGHRDFSPDTNHNGIIDPWERIKECPCFDAIPEYKDLRP